MGLFRNLTDSMGITRRKTLSLDVDGAFNPVEFVNSIMGVKFEREEFTRPDGTKGTRMVAKGATPEMQEFATGLTDSIQGIIGDITNLTEIGAAIDNEAFDPVIQAVRDTQTSAREKAFNEASRLQEQNLARSGVSDSTSGIEARNLLTEDLVDKATEDERDLVLLAEDLRDKQINRSGIGLGANQGERGALSGAAESQRSQGLNFATGQQSLKLGATQSMFNDRTSANQDQAKAFGQTAGKVAAMFSDVRLKDNISLLKTVKDVNIYQFTYKHDLNKKVHEGVMAQEVLSTIPNSVEMDTTGYYKVNYNIVGEYLNA